MKTLIMMGLLLTTQAFALTVNIKGGQTSFKAVGRPAMLKILGEGPAPTGALTVNNDKIDGELTLNMEALTTKRDTRDEHMKEKYLEVKKFPEAKLKIKKSSLAADQLLNEKDKESVLEADLTLHGVTKTISINTKTESVNDNKTVLISKFIVNLEDYKIDIPQFAGITVAKDVEVEIKSEVEKEK